MKQIDSIDSVAPAFAWKPTFAKLFAAVIMAVLVACFAQPTLHGQGGTVTSVAVEGANGIEVSGSPITSSGTISLSLSDIYVLSVGGLTGPVATAPGYGLVLQSTGPLPAIAAQAGPPVTLRGSDAVTGFTTGAAPGGKVTIRGGDAKGVTGQNANGGDIELLPGHKIGNGRDGRVVGNGIGGPFFSGLLKTESFGAAFNSAALSSYGADGHREAPGSVGDSDYLWGHKFFGYTEQGTYRYAATMTVRVLDGWGGDDGGTHQWLSNAGQAYFQWDTLRSNTSMQRSFTVGENGSVGGAGIWGEANLQGSVVHKTRMVTSVVSNSYPLDPLDYHLLFDLADVKSDVTIDLDGATTGRTITIDVRNVNGNQVIAGPVALHAGQSAILTKNEDETWSVFGP